MLKFVQEIKADCSLGRETIDFSGLVLNIVVRIMHGKIDENSFCIKKDQIRHQKTREQTSLEWKKSIIWEVLPVLGKGVNSIL